MLKAAIVRVVELCITRPWWIIALSLALGTGSGVYAARHFAIKTDINDLLSPDLPWAQRALRYMKDFPQRDVIVVLDAPTPEIADETATMLAKALRAQPGLFRAVSQPGSGPFFEENGLLFLPTDAVARLTNGLQRADPLLGVLAANPSLKGTLDVLSLVLAGARHGDLTVDDMARPVNMAANTVQAALAGQPASFSWRALASGKEPGPDELQRFLLIEPVLDFSALEPGRAATDAITKAAADLQLQEKYQVRVRQTGRVPMDDDEFGTLKQNAGINAAGTLVALMFILWMALRSLRMIFAVAFSLFVGLAVATAAGLFLVGALNLISVAFFILFVGLGVDFGIQFSVRYRAERHEYPDLRTALRSAAVKSGGTLALASVATAVGFCSFLPTAYRGLSELGEIAGVGMIIAFVMSITLLPALLTVLNPPGEPRPMGFAMLAPIDRFLERHRLPVIVTTILVVVLASPLLWFLPFDFNPLHLQSPKVESVATYLELAKNPLTGANAIDIVAPNVAAAHAVAQQISALPQVAQAKTIENFIPADQDAKLKLIHEAATTINASLDPEDMQPPPSDQDNVQALSRTAARLSESAGSGQGPGADALRRLAGLLSRLAAADSSARERTQTAFVAPLRSSLAQIKSELKAQPITLDTVPPDLKRDWIAPDGRARVEAVAKGDPEDTDTLRRFVTAVLAVEPGATGPAVALYEAGNTVVDAFIESGAFALCAIAVLLLIALRQIVDVLLMLVPLLLAGVVTLELCVVLDLPLNFANIIALPLLLGVGVAFKIYYIVAWRAGKTGLLQSSLTRAVIFSAMTTATAFGSLWLSNHPGTSSMGKLMALSLLCTMAAAVFFQPVLMGPPRQTAKAAPLSHNG